MVDLLLDLLGPAWAIGALWAGIALVRGRPAIRALEGWLCNEMRWETPWLGQDGIRAAAFAIITLAWPLVLAGSPLIRRSLREDQPTRPPSRRNAR